MKFFACAASCLAVFALVGCGKPAPPPPPPEPGRPSLPTAAQGKLQTMKLWMGPEEVDAELALSPIQQETGMMFRTNLAENSGMLFVLPYPQRASFWMTNCPLPLSAAYIDASGAILEVHPLHSNDPVPVVADHDNVQFVLEMNSGWFDRHHIAAGTLIATEHGSLPAVFLRRQ